MRDWGIQAIHGVIDVHWVLRKNDILKNIVKELTAGNKNEDATPQEEKKRKSLDELEKTKSLVDYEYARITSDLETGHHTRNELEKSFDENKAKASSIQSEENNRSLQRCQK